MCKWHVVFSDVHLRNCFSLRERGWGRGPRKIELKTFDRDRTARAAANDRAKPREASILDNPLPRDWKRFHSVSGHSIRAHNWEDPERAPMKNLNENLSIGGLSFDDPAIPIVVNCKVVYLRIEIMNGTAVSFFVVKRETSIRISKYRYKYSR